MLETLRERIAVVLFTDDIIHGHLQYWEAPTADWSRASVNLKEAYYRLADEILALIQLVNINPCYGCEYRKPEVREYINVCLRDGGCIRDD